ncbi:MAG: hypothetical protein ABEL97_00175 [Salinibacter sp.]
MVSLVLLGFTITACASSRTAQERADDRSKVVGVWEYRTNGTNVLQRGTLRISVEDGRLVGQIRDTWQGTVEARVSLHGSRMEIDLRRLRISGRVRRGRFKASIRREFETLTVRPRRQRRQGYFVAQRVRSTADTDNRTRYGCRSLLREHSYKCSPFQQGQP